MDILKSGNLKIKILLVDDKKENLISLERLLEEKDNSIQFIKATSGQEALKISFYEDLALILLDVRMPEMDGFEVANLLQMNSKTKNIPIIFVTASDHETSQVLEGYEKGAIDYLFKPLNPAITKAKVRSFVRMYIQRREVEILTNLVNNSLDLMCILDASTLKIVAANPAWEPMLGYKPEELHGKVFTSLAVCEPERSYYLNKALADNITLSNFETCVFHKNKEEKFILWSFVLKDNLWYCNGREYTDRKVAEEKLLITQEALQELNNELEDRVKSRTEELRRKNEELRKINSDLDNFVYTASHDLKAPISNIEGLVNVLKADCSDSEEVSSLFKMINTSILRFKHVINDLTDMAKVQSEEVSDEAIVSFMDISREVRLMIGELIKEYTPGFVEDYSGAPEIKFSRKNLKNIFYNLITNAIKYSTPGRRPLIKIKTVRTDGYILLSVEDNGLGIKAEDKDKVFSMFKRLHDHVEGTGMGMPLVKRIIDNSGGKIELESKLGEGSVFKVYFKPA